MNNATHGERGRLPEDGQSHDGREEAQTQKEKAAQDEIQRDSEVNGCAHQQTLRRSGIGSDGLDEEKIRGETRGGGVLRHFEQTQEAAETESEVQQPRQLIDLPKRGGRPKGSKDSYQRGRNSKLGRKATFKMLKKAIERREAGYEPDAYQKEINTAVGMFLEGRPLKEMCEKLETYPRRVYDMLAAGEVDKLQEWGKFRTKEMIPEALRVTGVHLEGNNFEAAKSVLHNAGVWGSDPDKPKADSPTIVFNIANFDPDTVKRLLGQLEQKEKEPVTVDVILDDNTST